MIKKNLLKLIVFNSIEKKAFFAIFSISLICLSSLLQANQLYMDDFYRVMEGKTYWEENGRPVASLVSLILQLGSPLTDISPLPQLLGFCLYSLSIIFIAKIFEIDNLILLVLSGIVFVINPYNLSIYSFTFDAFPMSLGVFAATLAFYFTAIAIETKEEIKNKIIFFFVSFLLLIITLCLYQPTSSFYLISFTFYLLLKLCKKTDFKNSLQCFFIYLSILFLSFAAYIPIKNHYITGDYTLTHSQLPPFYQLPQTIINNVIESWNNIRWGLGDNIIRFLMNNLLVLIALTIVWQLIRNNLKNKNHFLNLFGGLLLAIFYCLILITSFVFPSFLLASPIWHTRIFTGFTAVVGIGCLFLSYFWTSYLSSIFKYFLIFYISLILLCFTNLSLTYGNFIHHQHEYEQKIGTLMIADLEKASAESSIALDNLKISFANSERIRDIRRNVLNRKAMEKYPVLYSLAYPYFTTDNFGIKKFRTFGLNFQEYSNNELKLENMDYYVPTQKPIINRQLYNIYLENNDVLVVVFKK